MAKGAGLKFLKFSDRENEDLEANARELREDIPSPQGVREFKSRPRQIIFSGEI